VRVDVETYDDCVSPADAGTTEYMYLRIDIVVVDAPAFSSPSHSAALLRTVTCIDTGMSHFEEVDESYVV